MISPTIEDVLQRYSFVKDAQQKGKYFWSRYGTRLVIDVTGLTCADHLEDVIHKAQQIVLQKKTYNKVSLH